MDEDKLLEYVREWLHYEEDTGFLFWKKSSNHGTRKVGRRAGRSVCNGYFVIKLMGKSFRVHRIIFLIKEGRFPYIIDHINRDRGDNRWSNLREVNNRENCFNRTLSKRNKTGITGIYFLKPEEVYTVTYGNIFVGMSKSLFEAACMRKSEELKYE